MSPTLLIGMSLAIGAPGLKDRPAKSPAIEGEWMLVTRTVAGKPENVGDQGNTRFVLSPGRWAIHNAGSAPAEWQMELDPSARPAAITVFKSDGDKRTSEMFGIYKVEGDTLTISCVFKGERPTKFESPAGSEVRLLTFRRILDK